MKNITKHPKPKHIADNMPKSLVIKHVSDQGPWLMYKLAETSGQGKVVIKIIHEFYTGSSFGKRKKVKNLDKLE
jgi:hypothetical protein